MAKGKKKRSRQGIVSKLANVALLLLGFSRPIQIFLEPGTIDFKARRIAAESTFGLSEGRFDMAEGLRMYTPPIAATALGFLKSHLMKKFPVRR